MGESEKFWRSKAAQFAAEYNFAWWLQSFLVALFFIGCLSAIAIIFIRKFDYPVVQALWVGLGAVPVTAILCLWRTRGKFIRQKEALPLIDDANGLHNRLTCAAQGVGAWPAPFKKIKRAFRWNPRVILFSSAISILLPVIACFIPLGQTYAALPAATTLPAAWTQVEEWIEELKQAEVVQPEALDHFEAQLEQLKKQDPRDWYSHNSLEAGDNLRNRMDQSLGALDRNLQSAQDSLGQLSENKDHLSQSQAEELSAALNQALEGLKMGTMPLNKELADKFSQMDPATLKQISAAQMKELQQALKNAQSKTQSILGDKGQSTELQFDGELCENGDCAGANCKDGKCPGKGHLPGKGGISRGRGDAPLILGQQESQVDITRRENLTNDDLRNAALGDSLGVGIGEHSRDQNRPLLNQSAGVTGSTGDGGEAVWRYQYRPEEEETLRKFYQ